MNTSGNIGLKENPAVLLKEIKYVLQLLEWLLFGEI